MRHLIAGREHNLVFSHFKISLVMMKSKEEESYGSIMSENLFLSLSFLESLKLGLICILFILLPYLTFCLAWDE